jgi:hypothetical protein
MKDRAAASFTVPNSSASAGAKERRRKRLERKVMERERIEVIAVRSVKERRG